MRQSQYQYGTPVDATYVVEALNCNGNENRLEECPYRLGSTCGSFNTLAGVYCIGTFNSSVTIQFNLLKYINEK